MPDDLNDWVGEEPARKRWRELLDRTAGFEREIRALSVDEGPRDEATNKALLGLSLQYISWAMRSFPTWLDLQESPEETAVYRMAASLWDALYLLE